MRSFEERVTQALDAAREAQDEFWEAIRELEEVLGGEIDDDRDLRETSVEALIEEFAPEVEADA